MYSRLSFAILYADMILGAQGNLPFQIIMGKIATNYMYCLLNDDDYVFFKNLAICASKGMDNPLVDEFYDIIKYLYNEEEMKVLDGYFGR